MEEEEEENNLKLEGFLHVSLVSSCTDKIVIFIWPLLKSFVCQDYLYHL